MSRIFALLNAFAICVCQIIAVTTASNYCDTNASGELMNKTQCLAGIGAAAEDTSRFWFGDWYVANCPAGPARYTIECASTSYLNADQPQSLASMMFTSGTFDKSKLSTYVDVVYDSPAGEYQACGNTYKREATRFRLNPLSMDSHETWACRNVPQVTWSARTNTSYTLLVIDAGNGFNHGVYTNIRGGSLDNAEVVKAYHGPRTTKTMANQYAFILFEQSNDNMTLLPLYKQMFSPYFQGVNLLNISEFAADQQLQGPVGLNWVSAVGDGYSIESWQSGYVIIENCAALVEKALVNNSRPFLPQTPALSVFIKAEFATSALSFTSCCKMHDYRDGTVTLNPLGDAAISAVHVRSQASKTLQLRRTGMYANASVAFAGKHLTLLVIDPDVPLPSLGTTEHPFVHWMVTNIEDGDITKGDEVHGYLGPMPPDQAPHTYYFLLYEQSSKLSTNNTHKFAGDKCDKSYTGRCLFNITAFVDENDLKLVGVTWMMSEISPFVRYSYIQSGRPASEMCAGVPGYADPCPTGKAVTMATANQHMVMFIVALFMSHYF